MIRRSTFIVVMALACSLAFMGCNNLMSLDTELVSAECKNSKEIVVSYTGFMQSNTLKVYVEDEFNERVAGYSVSRYSFNNITGENTLTLNKELKSGYTVYVYDKSDKNDKVSDLYIE